MKAFFRKITASNFRYLCWLVALLALGLQLAPRSRAFVATTFSTTGTYTRLVETTGTYQITAVGAHGGESTAPQLAGTGATMVANFSLTAGDTLTIFVGDNGEDGVGTTNGGGGGGGSAVILNGTQVLIAAGGGGGGCGAAQGFGGVANTNSTAGAGTSPGGAGGGGFGATAPSPTVACTGVEGGKLATQTTIGASANGRGSTSGVCSDSGGDGGQGFGGGGGANDNVGGGGGGYKGGNGATSNGSGGSGGDSFINTSVASGAIVSATAGTQGGSSAANDFDGSVTIDGPALTTSAGLWSGASSNDWNTATNWIAGAVPSSSEAGVIPASGVTNNPTISSTSPTVAKLIVASGRTLTVASGRTLTVSGNATVNGSLTVTGALSVSGTLTNTGGTVTFNGSTAQTVPALTYNNLTINNAAGVSLSSNTTVNGQLVLTTNLSTGSNTLTMPASAPCPSGTGDVIGNVKRTGLVNSTAYCFGNTDNKITFNSGTPPTDVTVTLAKPIAPGISNAVSRLYTITPTGGSGYLATLRLRYLDSEVGSLTESTLRLWRNNGSTWEDKGGTVNTSSNYVEATGITAFSPWAIAGPSAPTAITLVNFKATSLADGALLEWQTGFEVHNLGFRIWREREGKRGLVNRQVIAGSALTSGLRTVLQAGEAYRWFDASSTQTTAYWLEDIDLSGQSTWHGPVYPADDTQSPRFEMPQLARTLSQLANKQSQVDSSTVVQTVARPIQESVATSNAKVWQSQSAIVSQFAAKIFVTHEALYRLSAAELAAIGFAVSTEPSHLQLFVDGQEIPIAISLNKDGHFEALEFYGLGLDTPSTAARCYWLINGSAPGKRFRPQATQSGFSALSQPFTQTVERRDRTIYFAGLLNGDRENFFGDIILSQPLDQSLNLPNLYAAASQPATLELTLQGVTQQAHRVAVQLNGNPLGFVDFSGQNQGNGRFTIPHALLLDGLNTVRLTAQNGGNDLALVDNIRISYQHKLRADNNLLTFPARANQQMTIAGFSSNNLRIFDVTNPEAPSELLGQIQATQNDGYTLSVAPLETGQRRLMVLSNDQAQPVAGLKANYPSSLKQATGADFIIISPRQFFTELEPLRQARLEQGYKVAVVDLDDIYDEFNFGHKAVAAIRDFLWFAKNNWQTPPRFVLLVGDATYDPRGYLGLGNLDLLPTKLLTTALLETASDDWLADFNNDKVADLSLGRLPVRTEQEAAAVVAKILRYEAMKIEPQALLVADANVGFDFEAASAQVRELLQSDYRVAEIKRGQVGTTTAKAELLAALEAGQQIVNYSGHASVGLWQGNLLVASEARALRNEKLPVFILMTCLNGFYLDLTSESLAESLLKAEAGGAVGVWASSALCQPEQQVQMNLALYGELLSGRSLVKPTLGEATRRAKQAITDTDLRASWLFFGDPSIRLK